MKRVKRQNQKTSQRIKRVRAVILGTAKKPRCTVFRSNTNLYIQLIDDENQSTLVAGKLTDVKDAKVDGMTIGVAKAFELGKLVATKALEKKIDSAIFDRGRYRYHGKIKALAEGLREGGLKI